MPSPLKLPKAVILNVKEFQNPLGAYSVLGYNPSFLFRLPYAFGQTPL